MNDFYTKMDDTLTKAATRASMAAMACRGSDPEGCVLYEDLLVLKADIDGAIANYREEVPACSRDDIRRMVDTDLGITDDDCTCNDRSWYGMSHDSACPLAGRARA